VRRRYNNMERILVPNVPNLKAVVLRIEIGEAENPEALKKIESVKDLVIPISIKNGLIPFTSVEKAEQYIENELKPLGLMGVVIKVNDDIESFISNGNCWDEVNKNLESKEINSEDTFINFLAEMKTDIEEIKNQLKLSLEPKVVNSSVYVYGKDSENLSDIINKEYGKLIKNFKNNIGGLK
jgi:hypothetical protein